MNKTQLYEPDSFTIAKPSKRRKVCNGCGSSQSKFDFVPDNLLGLKIGEACNIHDWMYHEGKTLEDKKEADRVFLNNMCRLINANCKQWCATKRVRLWLANKYYDAVKRFGGPAFWDKG